MHQLSANMGKSHRGILLVFMFLCVVVSICANQLKPTELMADVYPRTSLKESVPASFSEWQMSNEQPAEIIDPEKQRVIEYLYSETLSETYFNEGGNSVMLSIAYGKDQSDYTAVHKPELCYPAVGFHIDDSKLITIKLDTNRAITVRYLKAKLGERIEPIMYWTTYGNRLYSSKIEKKMIIFDYSTQNLIGDGLLVRVSTIDPDTEHAKQVLINYIKSWYASISEPQRKRFFGEVAA